VAQENAEKGRGVYEHSGSHILKIGRDGDGKDVKEDMNNGHC
jgi:hypothetical protein